MPLTFCDEISTISTGFSGSRPSLAYMQSISLRIASHLALTSSCEHWSACVPTSFQWGFNTRESSNFSQLPISLSKLSSAYSARFTTKRKRESSSMERRCTILYQSFPPKSIRETDSSPLLLAPRQSCPALLSCLPPEHMTASHWSGFLPDWSFQPCYSPVWQLYSELLSAPHGFQQGNWTQLSLPVHTPQMVAF